MAGGEERGTRSGGELRPPLPPETRTVGQLVAEAVHFYGSRFWPSLALGVPPAILVVAAAPLDRIERLVLVVTGGSLLVTASYVAAFALVAGRRPGPLPLAFATGVLVFAPVPVLATAFILPAIAWLAFLGFAVPAVLLEERGFRAAFRRGIELARADYVHALGSLATLVIVVFLCQGVLFFVLRGAVARRPTRGRPGAGSRRRSNSLSQPVRLAFAEVALEEPAVPLLVAEDV